MTLLSNDPQTQLAFSVYENKGIFAVLLGSGLSRAAGIPTGWEITLDLIRRIAVAQEGMPVGRIGWDESKREKIFSETRSEPMKAAILNAGFARADPEFLDLFAVNLNRISAQMRWSWR